MTRTTPQGEPSNEHLMRATVRNDLVAFEMLYGRLAPAALSIAFHICKSADRAEDAVQEGFLSVWRARDRYDPDLGAVHTWVFQIIRFSAIDAARKDGRHDARRKKYVDVSEHPADTPELPANLVAADEAAQLRAAIEGLPAKQSEVIERAFFGGMSHTEIARELDLPLGTVKGRMRLGFDLLRQSVAA
jgi:RNA polymerase sigma-70 factor (ECF subfamily)